MEDDFSVLDGALVLTLALEALKRKRFARAAEIAAIVAALAEDLGDDELLRISKRIIAATARFAPAEGRC